MRLHLSANLGFLWRDLPLVQRIARAADCGFDAVEMHDDWQGVPLEELVEALGQARMPVESINTAMAGNAGIAAVAERRAEAIAAIDRAFAAAKAIGARAVHITAGKAGASPENMAVFMGNIRHACALASRSGLRVLVEPIAPANVPGYFLSDLAMADAILEEVADPALAILFDCFHVATLGHDLSKAFNARAARIGHVQIAGFPGRGEPSTGCVDYALLLPAMVEAGYRGAFGSEYHPRQDVESGLGWMRAFR